MNTIRHLGLFYLPYATLVFPISSETKKIMLLCSLIFKTIFYVFSSLFVRLLQYVEYLSFIFTGTVEKTFFRFYWYLYTNVWIYSESPGNVLKLELPLILWKTTHLNMLEVQQFQFNPQLHVALPSNPRKKHGSSSESAQRCRCRLPWQSSDLRYARPHWCQSFGVFLWNW